jgi:hypothetical protein
MGDSRNFSTESSHYLDRRPFALMLGFLMPFEYIKKRKQGVGPAKILLCDFSHFRNRLGHVIAEKQHVEKEQWRGNRSCTVDHHQSFSVFSAVIKGTLELPRFSQEWMQFPIARHS